jgi:phospholipase C
VAGLATKIDHIVVLMLENRSFDCLLGNLHQPPVPGFNGLTGTEANTYTAPDGSVQNVPVKGDPTLDTGMMTIPDPDPGELFTDMNVQLFGLNGTRNPLPPPMSGFADNYMRQQPADEPYEPKSAMHCYTADQVPVISQLARAFAVSDQWHASAPCQTWPNRFFVHTATAGGHINNAITDLPYTRESIFHRLDSLGRSSRVYFHDVPQSATLADQWPVATQRFRPIESFWDDAEHGDLADYSFIEPRYFTDVLLGQMPNDQHPPHDVVYGEQLIATVYNAIRSSPAWKKTLLVLTYDEHGGCYDHAPPPLATAPDPAPPGAVPDTFLFDAYGVRVPAIIISPYIAPGTILRSAANGIAHQGGVAPFDHTSIIRTVLDRFGPANASLTSRDAAAPSLDLALNLDTPSNDGPDHIAVPAYKPTANELQKAHDLPPNAMQKSLCGLSAFLPQAGGDLQQHLNALRNNQQSFLNPPMACVADAASFVRENIDSFLGRF